MCAAAVKRDATRVFAGSLFVSICVTDNYCDNNFIIATHKRRNIKAWQKLYIRTLRIILSHERYYVVIQHLARYADSRTIQLQAAAE